MSRFANVFNIYDEVDSDIVDCCCCSQIELIKELQNSKLDADDIIANYLILVKNTEEFNRLQFFQGNFSDSEISYSQSREVAKEQSEKTINSYYKSSNTIKF